MKFIDAAPLVGTRKTSDGYLVAEVRTARTGIQDYAGYEVGKPDQRVVKVYRPEDQVFDQTSLASYAHKPVTNDHPDEAVTADNWKNLSVGQIGDEVARDGEYVRVPLIVMDAATIRQIEAGKRELSAGYVCDLAFEPGVTPDGQAYDAVQRNIRINHVAIVQHGRAGHEARIGDGAKTWGIRPFTLDDKKEPKMNLKTIVLGDKAVQVLDTDAPIIEQIKDQWAKDRSKLISDHDAEIAKKDAELAKKDAELASMKEKVLEGPALDAAIVARGDLIAKAKAIVPDIKTDGLSDAAIRKAVVVAKFGDSVASKSEAYIDARFDVLVEDLDSTVELANGISQIADTKAGVKDYEKAHNSYVDRLTRRAS